MRIKAPDPACNSVCVFCGANMGRNPAVAQAARALGAALAGAGVALVYGGGAMGLMGELARAALSAGGRVTGIITRDLVRREVAFADGPELIVTETMHERKAQMHARADAFIVMPGGVGTLDEAIEAITWAHLDLHAKPIVFLDIDGYWSAFRALIAAARDGGFTRPGLEDCFDMATSVDAALARLGVRIGDAA